jgi:hypothetical protein
MANPVPSRGTAQREAEREAILADLRTIRFTPAVDRQRGVIYGLQTIARESGVSLSTVYAFLRTGHIHWRTQKRIARGLRRIHDEYGYEAPRPQPPARAPEQPKTSESITKYLRFR